MSSSGMVFWDGRRAAEERFQPVAIEVVDGGAGDGLRGEHVLGSAPLGTGGRVPGVRRCEVASGGADAQVVAPAGHGVEVEGARYPRRKHVSLLAGGRREKDLAQNRSNRRVAAVRGDGGDPVLDRVEGLRRDAGHSAEIVDAEEGGGAGGIRECNQFTRRGPRCWGTGRRGRRDEGS